MEKKKRIIILLVFILTIVIGGDICLILLKKPDETQKPEPNPVEPDQTQEYNTICTKKVLYQEGMTTGEFLPFPVEEETVTYNIYYNQDNELLYYYFTTDIKCFIQEQYNTIITTQYDNLVNVETNQENLEIHQTFDKYYPNSQTNYQHLVEGLQNKGYACQ